MLVAVIFGFGFLCGNFLHRGGGPGKRGYNTAVVLQQIQSLSQLVTVKYVMEKVEIQEDPPQNLVRAWFWDQTRVILVAHGIVKAGVDLSKLEPGDLRISGRSIRIALPPAQITDAYLDELQTKVIEHNTSFLRDFNKDLEQTARQNALDDIRRAARKSGIIKDADERARAQLAALFRQSGMEVEIVTK
jgi:hypothetical protein